MYLYHIIIVHFQYLRYTKTNEVWFTYKQYKPEKSLCYKRRFLYFNMTYLGLLPNNNNYYIHVIYLS